MKTTQPNGTVTEYAYNSDGNVTKVTATKVNGECETLRYLYALDGSLTAAISGSTIDEYTYTANGNLASVTRNKDYQLKFVYDANGKLTAIKEHRCGIYTPEAVTGYFYDAADRLVRVTENGTFGYRIVYLANGSVTSSEVYEGGDLLAEYEYYADGQLKQQTNGAGTISTYSYDAFKNVTALTAKAMDGTLLYQETNTYNGKRSVISRTVNGKVAELSGVTGTATYTYDALDRLVKEQGSYGTISYTYDSMGNRLTKTQNGVTTSYVYDLCNKLLSETTSGKVTEYIYDGLGNLTKKVSSEGTATYTYDALNHLTEVVNPDGTWQHNTYDASGIRSMIAENGVTTEFMTFNGLVLSSYNKNGEQTEHYYYSNSLLAAEYAGTETELYYYLKNSHGDVAGLIDKQGSLSSAYAYDAFGNLVAAENGLSESEDTLSTFLYSGEQYDQISGLYYLRARQYDTVIGRFTQEDTYLGDGRNLYSYVHNNPLKYTDPSGHGGVEDLDDGDPMDDVIDDKRTGFGGTPINQGQTSATGYASGGTSIKGLKIAGIKGLKIAGRDSTPTVKDATRVTDGSCSGSGSATGNVQKISNRGVYVPTDSSGNPIPLMKQTVNGQDIPLPDSAAKGRPHTVLGGKVSSATGEVYRQSATFSDGTWPTVNGMNVPWSEVHWTNHGTPQYHANPHQHIFKFAPDSGGWIRSEPTGFYPTNIGPY